MIFYHLCLEGVLIKIKEGREARRGKREKKRKKGRGGKDQERLGRRESQR